MAKLKLDLEPDPAVTVIGISCHERDYRLCWSINRAFGLALARRSTDIADTDVGRVANYAAYDHVDEPTQARYTLVSNHSGDGVLLKEQRHADFFLVVDNELVANAPDLLEQVRSTEFVLTAFPVPFAHLRAGHKLLL